MCSEYLAEVITRTFKRVFEVVSRGCVDVRQVVKFVCVADRNYANYSSASQSVKIV